VHATEGLRTGDRGVRHDEAFDAVRQREFGDVGASVVIEVRRDFDQEGNAACKGFACSCDRLEQRLQFVLVLQAAEARRVGRRDVDRDIRAQRAEFLETGDVVGDAVCCVLVGADVDAADAGVALDGGQVSSRRGDAFIVEPQAVDDGLVFNQTEDARLRVAGLRARRHRSGFDKSETEGQHRFRDLRVLVKAGRESNRVGEFEPQRLHAQSRVVRFQRGFGVDDAERFDGQAMRKLRIEPRQDGPRQS